jgi:hypothetical protein
MVSILRMKVRNLEDGNHPSKRVTAPCSDPWTHQPKTPKKHNPLKHLEDESKEFGMGIIHPRE